MYSSNVKKNTCLTVGQDLGGRTRQANKVNCKFSFETGPQEEIVVYVCVNMYIWDGPRWGLPWSSVCCLVHAQTEFCHLDTRTILRLPIIWHYCWCTIKISATLRNTRLRCIVTLNCWSSNCIFKGNFANWSSLLSLLLLILICLYHQVDPKMLKLTMEQAREVLVYLYMYMCYIFSGDSIMSPHSATVLPN